MDVFEGLLSGLGLRLSTGKPRIAGEVNGFGFISFRFARRYRPSSKRVLMHFFPSRDAWQGSRKRAGS